MDVFIHDLILRQLNQHCSASLNQNQICRRDLSLNAQNLSLKTFKEWLHSSLRDREVTYFSRCFWNKHMPLQKKLCLSIANMQQVICVRIYFQYWRQIFVHRDGSLCTAGPTFHGQSTTIIIITVATNISPSQQRQPSQSPILNIIITNKINNDIVTWCWFDVQRAAVYKSKYANTSISHSHHHRHHGLHQLWHQHKDDLGTKWTVTMSKYVNSGILRHHYHLLHHHHHHRQITNGCEQIC